MNIGRVFVGYIVRRSIFEAGGSLPQKKNSPEFKETSSMRFEIIQQRTDCSRQSSRIWFSDLMSKTKGRVLFFFFFLPFRRLIAKRGSETSSSSSITRTLRNLAAFWRQS